MSHQTLNFSDRQNTENKWFPSRSDIFPYFTEKELVRYHMPYIQISWRIKLKSSMRNVMLSCADYISIRLRAVLCFCPYSSPHLRISECSFPAISQQHMVLPSDSAFRWRCRPLLWKLHTDRPTETGVCRGRLELKTTGE